MTHESTAQKIIISELNKLPGPKIHTEKNIRIICPFHTENKPSCSVIICHDEFIPLGFFHCFGCGEKGNYNKLAERYNLKKVKSHQKARSLVHTPNEIELRKQDIGFLSLHLTLSDIYIDPIFVPFPKKETWRRIRGSIIIKVGGTMILEKYGNTSSLLFPVVINNILEGSIKARIKKKKDINYIFSEGSWVKTCGIFPFDFVSDIKSDYVVLVEGVRDALRLLQNGIPALAILGTKNWSLQKRDLILSLTPKIVFLAFDGDYPGEQCQKQVANDLRNFVEIEIFSLHEKKDRGLDPASMPYPYIKILKKFITQSLTNL